MQRIFFDALVVVGALLAVLVTCMVIGMAIGWIGLPKRRRLRANQDKQIIRPGSWFERPFYVDEPFTCVECGAAEVWSAESQQWYYEEIRGELYAIAKRCARCRSRRRAIAEARRRYEELCHRPERTMDETLTMTECGLVLVENEVFSPKHVQRIRELLNSIPVDGESFARVALIRERLHQLEHAAQDASQSGGASERPTDDPS